MPQAPRITHQVVWNFIIDFIDELQVLFLGLHGDGPQVVGQPVPQLEGNGIKVELASLNF